jgi:asparagine synthase (glutamine-hydrolysing)
MCGIFGHLSYHAPANAEIVSAMAKALAHRGPDGFGIHTSTDGAISFGAGRLAIIDLSAPAGVLHNEGGQISVAFNGEIYNHLALRAELEPMGHRFTTRTDTEVIVHGYEAWGLEVFSRLRGMFAIALWDARIKRLLLCRDRMGEKPLYYARLDDGSLIFASEAKALFEHPALPRKVNGRALPLFLCLGYVPAPQTLFAGVQKLHHGEMVIADPDFVRVEYYWRPQMNLEAFDTPNFGQHVKRVRAALEEAVQMRLMSDVPLGAFLSGGVDSTAVVALMARAMNRPVQTFTVGFHFPDDPVADEKFNVDARYAAMAAVHLKSDHNNITIQADERLAALLPQLIYSMDEPLAQPAIIQTAYVAALARHSGVPVLLSGDAGDELFAGYEAYRADGWLGRYLQVPELLRRGLTPILERIPVKNIRKVAEKSRDSNPVARYMAWMNIMSMARTAEIVAIEDFNITDVYKPLGVNVRPYLDMPKTKAFADRIAFASLNLWIPEDSNMRVDKMAMAMSVEARAPFEDHHLVELALKIPLGQKLRNGRSKAVLKDAVRDLVPAEILDRPKWGFVPPASKWLRTVFRPLAEKYLSREYVVAAGWFKPEVVSRFVEGHILHNEYHLQTVWALLSFHIWHALYIDQSLSITTPLTAQDLVG